MGHIFVNPFCVCVRRDISSPNKGKFDDDDDDDDDDVSVTMCTVSALGRLLKTFRQSSWKFLGKEVIACNCALPSITCTDPSNAVVLGDFDNLSKWCISSALLVFTKAPSAVAITQGIGPSG